MFDLFCGLRAISEGHDSGDLQVQGPGAGIGSSGSDLGAFPEMISKPVYS